MNKYIKGKNLLKLHNCLICHKNLNNYYPKILGQYKKYIYWSLNQYKINFKKNYFSRNNFLMKSQIQNIKILDINYIVNFLNNFKYINLKLFKKIKNFLIKK